MTSGCVSRCLSAGVVAVTGDVFQRRMGNGFARVWQVAGSPCIGPSLSACGGFQRRVRDLVPAVPLG